MHRKTGLKHQKIAADMVKLTKANRFAYKKPTIIDKASSQLYNLTIRTGFISNLMQ